VAHNRDPPGNFTKYSNIMQAKNYLGREGFVKKPLRPTLVILKFNETSLKA